MTRNDIQNVINHYPNLTNHGFGIFEAGMKRSAAERAEELVKQQAELLSQADMCTKVCKWLDGKLRSKDINKKHSSYGWKHAIGDQIAGRLTNGQFIAAALHCGLTMDWDGRGPNADFNLAESVWTEAVTRRESA